MKFLLSGSLLFLISCADRPVEQSTEPAVAAVYVGVAIIRGNKSNDCDNKCKEEIKSVQESIKNRTKK